MKQKLINKMEHYFGKDAKRINILGSCGREKV